MIIMKAKTKQSTVLLKINNIFVRADKPANIIKNNNKDRPKIISGITKGDELKKIKKGLAGIFDILVNEKPIITPIIVAKVADKEAIFILV